MTRYMEPTTPVALDILTRGAIDRYQQFCGAPYCDKLARYQVRLPEAYDGTWQIVCGPHIEWGLKTALAEEARTR